MANQFMTLARHTALQGISTKSGGPFGAVVVKNGKTIAIGHNEVVKNSDPTCHGEIQAIRNACKALNTFDLSGCELYTTAYPCPMCLGAIQWARIKKVYYGCTVDDSAAIGFDDKEFYENNQLELQEVDRDECLKLFNLYTQVEHTRY